MCTSIYTYLCRAIYLGRVGEYVTRLKLLVDGFRRSLGMVLRRGRAQSCPNGRCEVFATVYVYLYIYPYIPGPGGRGCHPTQAPLRLVSSNGVNH